MHAATTKKIIPALRAFGRMVDALDRATMVLAVALLAVVVCLSGAEIVARSLFSASSVELVDLSLQLSVLMNFVGYVVLLNRDEDIVVDYFYERLPRFARRTIEIVAAFAIAGFFLLLLLKSGELFRLGMRFRHPVFPIPQAVLAIPALAGAALCFIVSLRKLFDSLVGLHEGSDPEP